MANNMEEKEFDGVFRFTNPTDEDYIALWNNKEYLFPAMSTCPMIIPDESLDHIQEIRKKWAYKLAVREFYKGKEYFNLVKLGKGHPATFDEKLLQPFVDQCLKPLPEAKATVKELPKKKVGSKASKPITDGFDPKADFVVEE